jgi:ribosomal subunit interface protein
MELEIVFRGMEPSEALEKYVSKYFSKFKKYFGKEDPSSIFLNIVLEGHFTHHINIVEARVKTQHFDVIAKREGPEMYPLVDEVMHIVEQDLRKAKQRKVDDLRKRKKGNF